MTNDNKACYNVGRFDVGGMSKHVFSLMLDYHIERMCEGTYEVKISSVNANLHDVELIFHDEVDTFVFKIIGFPRNIMNFMIKC